MSHKEVVSGHLDDGENTSQEKDLFLLLLLKGKAKVLGLVDLCILEFGINRHSANHEENSLFLTAKAEQEHLIIRN